MNKKKIIGSLLAVVLILAASFFGLIQNQPENIDSQLPNYTSEPTEVTAATDATEPSEDIQPEVTSAPTEVTEAPTEETQAPTQPTQSQNKPSASQTIIDAAYALGQGEALDGTYTLTGIITSVKTAYSDHYENITVIISVPDSEDQPILCYRLEGEGVDDLIEGDIITVSGTLKNYKGTIEFDAGCQLETVTRVERPEKPTGPSSTNNDDSKEYVAWYIHTYGCLPDFYMTKNEAERLYGWSGGPLDKLAPGMCIGGDRFTNYQKVLPVKSGRYYTECDIDTIGANARGAKRIVFSNDGLVYYTDDHYDTFELLYGEP